MHVFGVTNGSDVEHVSSATYVMLTNLSSNKSDNLIAGNELFSTATLKPEHILILILEELDEPLTHPLSSLLIETNYIDLVRQPTAMIISYCNELPFIAYCTPAQSRFLYDLAMFVNIKKHAV